MTLKVFRLWALGFVFTIFATSAQGSPKMAIKKINLPRIPETIDVRSELPRRDAPLRVAALRVEFVRDTLSTTTGEGGFDYGQNDSFYFDPPPHDSLYFADHIEFQNFYWDKMSVGNLGFTCEVFPAGARAAYQLPKQMWQYNYNNGAEQLDKGLAELFRDAIQEADSDAAIVWNNYDLVIIFHAGAGAEFDLGFSSTPHDLPSAWMVKEDFRSQLNLPDGIPIDNNTGFVASGLILPETETHEGVQISMAGVISLMIGHWLGLPALYDKDEGDPVVGKWSMMDRGFGNFYGALPGPVDVWSSSHMGWTSIEDASTGGNRIMARFHQYMENDTPPPRSLKISVSSQEEFIFECRFRDPENDSVAYAWDRDGRRMTFKDDYSVEVEPGFRVPVRADDLDFDSPGSGIVIWHHDSGLDNLIDEGRFNSVDELRGLDLEEADGAQDIGRNYPFLTPGYGTDYGIFEDAWYGDNSAYKDANQGRLVSFNDDSYPNSRSNSGAFTHVKVDSISRRGAVMGFRYGRLGEIFSLKQLAEDGYNGSSVITGNFDDDLSTKEMMIFSPRRVRIYDLTGHSLDEIGLGSSTGPQDDNILVRDVNNDSRDDLVWVSNGDLVRMVSEPNLSWMFFTGTIYDSGIPLIAWGGSADSSVLVTISSRNDTTFIDRYNVEAGQSSSHVFPLEAGFPISLHRLGSAQSDSFLIIADPSLVLSTSSGLTILRSQPFQIDEINDIFPYPIGVADYDGSGMQDVIVGGGEGAFTWTVFKDILSPIPPDPIVKYIDGFDFAPEPPFDVNMDGKFDLIGTRGFVYQDINRQCDIAAFTLGGVFLENYPRDIVQSSGLNPTSRMDLGTLDFHSDGRLVVRSLGNQMENGGYKFYLDCGFDNGASLPGFPLAIDGWPSSIRFAEIDTIRGYDLIIALNDRVSAYSLPTTRYPNQSIWWQGPYRDNDHSNAIWEPATPFSPAPKAKLLEDNLCYNWPNPAKGESTAIRYTLNFPGTVSVEIFDIAGDKVASLSGSGEAGVPNEIIWNVTNIARGAYLAIVEATGSGKTERKTVKIAVVK